MKSTIFGPTAVLAIIIMLFTTPLFAKTTVINVKRMASELQMIVKNRAKLSCIELTVGSLKASGLTVISKSKAVIASSAARKLARSAGKKGAAAIDREERCHCDRGAAMAGYEIYERRSHLQKNKHNKRLNKKLMSFYPKDAAGKPRFLMIGERLDKSILLALPKPRENKRYDDCGRLCKRSRKRTNAKAVAAGKPEPFPNLEYPRKKSCN